MFHCDFSNNGIASLASWFVTCMYCCRASCCISDSPSMLTSAILSRFRL